MNNNNNSFVLKKLNRYMSPFTNQLKYCLKRVGRFYIRSPGFIFPRLGICIFIGLTVGLFYFDVYLIYKYRLK